MRRFEQQKEEGDEQTEAYKDALMLVAGWMYSHRGESFSLYSLGCEIGVSLFLCEKALSSEHLRGLYSQKTERSQQAYYSTAPELAPTVEGELYAAWLESQQSENSLGVQARYEFWQRAHEDAVGKRRHRQKKSY